jgi:O-6-methylguanine DNA methyltransferase
MIDLYTKNLDELWCGVALNESEIVATTFAFDEKKVLSSLLSELPYGLTFQEAQKNCSLADRVMQIMKITFDGKDMSFSFKFYLNHLSGYSQQVLKLTSLIPTGYVTNYGSLAKVAGGSPRSVGRVMATNPFAPIIPCHRIVAADMTLGGYGGGLKLKREILERENRNYNEVVEAKINDEILRLFPISMLKP